MAHLRPARARTSAAPEVPVSSYPTGSHSRRDRDGRAVRPRLGLPDGSDVRPLAKSMNGRACEAPGLPCALPPGGDLTSDPRMTFRIYAETKTRIRRFPSRGRRPPPPGSRSPAQEPQSLSRRRRNCRRWNRCCRPPTALRDRSTPRGRASSTAASSMTWGPDDRPGRRDHDGERAGPDDPGSGRPTSSADG
jgi:hypothetical protein